MPKGPRKHLKRLAAPRHLQIRRKERPFTIKANSGAHAFNECIPLGIVIRDMLHLTDTLTETRRVIARGVVKVDGHIRKDYKYAVGLMDVIEIPEVKMKMRVLPAPTHFLQLHKIPQKEIGMKPCKIVGKTTIKKGNLQLHLHDGRNIILPVKDPKTKPKEKYNSGDTVLISVPQQTIQDHIRLKQGITAIITGGDHNSFVGKLKKIDPKTKLGTLEGTDGSKILTAIQYVFPIGEDSPIISLPGAK